MRYAFPLILTPVNDGYVVNVPDLNIDTEGASIADAIEMAEDAIGLWGICRQDAGQKIPTPSTEAIDHAPNQLTAYAVVDFDAYRRKHDMRTVRKNVTLPSYLNELAEAAHLNFSQILQEGLKAKLGL